jgi:hypothetical protein
MRIELFMMLIALATLLPTALDAQAAGARAQSQTQGQAQGKTPQARIDAALQTAARARVPVALLQSRVAQGEARKIPPERIASAVEARLQSLLRALQTFDRANLEAGSEGELAIAADALEAGVSENALIKLTRSAPAERRVVAVAVLTDLVRLGNQSEQALSRVTGALVSNTALANLNAEVASQLRLGGLTSTLDGIVRIK